MFTFPRLFFLAVFASAALFAQSYTGSISGKVTDSSGLAIAKVKIVVTEESTNTAIHASSDSGDYNVSYLKPAPGKSLSAPPDLKSMSKTAFNCK